MNDQLRREIYLGEELRNSIRLIEIGFGEFQNLDGANDFYHLPMQLLASGFERFMKCYIVFGHLEQQEEFPSFNYLKGPGHDLLKLKEIILKDYFQTPSPALISDKDFLENNNQLNELIDILSEFGKFARYHNLDVITGSVNPSRDVVSEWKSFEDQIVLNNPDVLEKIGDIQTQKEGLEYVTRQVIIILEKFARALSRQFTLGRLGTKAQQYSPTVYSFLLINDDDLGNRDYRVQTNRFKSEDRRGHKRTESDEIERQTNPNFRHKNISKLEFDGEWPFYAKEVTIECRNTHWCVVSIDGYDYALNGAAQGRYKIESVHDAGMAILGKSIGPFIQMALEL